MSVDYSKIFAEYTDARTPGAVLRCFRDIEPEPLRWLWPGRIPLGKLTLLIGDPGLGKSLVTVDMAARLSRGTAFADGAACDRGSTIFLSAEDEAADTIRPRLDAAGADLSRVHVLDAVRVTLADGVLSEKCFSLETDIAALESALLQNPDVRLIVIDPLSAYLGGTDSHSNAEIRGLLSPLGAMAARRGVAVSAITHLRKSPGQPSIAQ
jgi:RecA-family ATPase